MWLRNVQHVEKGNETLSVVAVAVDKDKGSQNAFKWAIDHLLHRGQNVILIHVNTKVSHVPTPTGHHVPITDVNENVAQALREQMDAATREMFLPFHCFCSRKEIKCKDVVLEDTDIAKAIIEYVMHFSIENLVLGACNHGFFRFKTTDIPTSVSKAAPDFCNVYVINKGKILSARSSSRQPPTRAPSQTHISMRSDTPDTYSNHTNQIKGNYIDNGHLHPHSNASTYSHGSSYSHESSHSSHEDDIRSPFVRARGPNARAYGGISTPESDISFIGSNRSNNNRMFPALFDHVDSENSSRSSTLSQLDDDAFSSHDHLDSPLGIHSGQTCTSHSVDEMEAEMKRLKLELKQTMDMYSTARKEALNAKQKQNELNLWKIEKEQRLEKAKHAEEAALALVYEERMRCRAAMEAAEAAQRIAELEAQKRIKAERKALKEAEERKEAMHTMSHGEDRYRRYSIEEIERATDFFNENLKIGEGGYGPVYRCTLDHTPVAVKILRSESAGQGRKQFQQEVEVLSCIRHPNMVLLLGACPEYGCLVYEYMANGSLEDCLFCRENIPPLSWQLRFQIACEIGTALLFLHQTKPEPLVHRDLKPGNILLDRNFVSKISDVGLARLVPPTVADTVTQYRMTSTAGTFCYIDPEYQQTGMLGIKSDVYSLGIMLLQIITARPPMGLTHHVEMAIEEGTFEKILDPVVHDWPVEEALKFAKIALQCAELRRKDRPDLGKEILPELERLRILANQHTPH